MMSTPTIDKKPEEKKRGLSMKIRLQIIGVCIPVIILLAWLYTPPSPEKAPQAQLLDDQLIVTVTSTPRKIKVPFGKRIHFQLTTENMVWWVRANGKQTDKFQPINSPEFEDKDYGEHLHTVEVWVEDGKTAQLGYYFTRA